MAKDTCQGCQSFCMLGKQTVSSDSVIFEKNGKKIEHTKNQQYPTSWKKWKDISKDNTIQHPDKLSAQSQQDLIAYVKAAWNEGEISLEDISNSVTEWKNKHPNGIKGYMPSIGSVIPYDSTGIEGAQANSEDIIHDYHYNKLCNVLSESTSGVTSDLKGDYISNDAKEGPIVGSSHDRQSQNKIVEKEELIKASYYTKLQERASKLMYHPYQCNICNIYEGGEWLEIVKETWKALKETGPHIYYGKPGSKNFVNLTVNGETVNTRLDCSGAVSAAMYFYCKTLGITADCKGQYATPSMGPGWGDPLQAGFHWVGRNGPWQAGDIQVRMNADSEHETGHTQIVAENGSSAFSGGSTSGLNAGGPDSDATNQDYDGCWRLDGA